MSDMDVGEALEYVLCFVLILCVLAIVFGGFASCISQVNSHAQ